MQPVGLDSISELERLILAQNGGLALPAQQSMIISCPKKMVGRVIGKNGETIKALQQFTGAQIQIDQRSDPTRVSIAGAPKAMQMATSMVQDIVAGTFKGFAMLRSYATQATKAPGAVELLGQPAPVYIEGYGFIPPSQFSDAGEGPYGYSQLQGFGNEQVPSQASLNALTQLYNLQNQQDLNMGMPNVTSQFNDIDQSSHQQAHMASLARSFFEAPEMKRANGIHSNGLTPASQQELPSSIYASAGLASSAGLGSGNWSQAPALTLEAAPLKSSPKHSSEHSHSRDHSPTTAGGAASSAMGPQDPNNLAAQLQALSLLSNFQESKRDAASETLQPGPKWNVAGQSNGSTSPTRPLPHGWMQITDPEKRVLYHNYLTGHTQYTQPTAGQPVQEAGSSGTSEADKSAAFPSLGQRMSGPASVGHSLHSGDSTAAMLGQRMSGPASVGQGQAGPDFRAGTTEAQTAGLDAISSGLGPRLQEHEFKIGNRLPPTGLFH